MYLKHLAQRWPTVNTQGIWMMIISRQGKRWRTQEEFGIDSSQRTWVSWFEVSLLPVYGPLVAKHPSYSSSVDYLSHADSSKPFLPAAWSSILYWYIILKSGIVPYIMFKNMCFHLIYPDLCFVILVAAWYSITQIVQKYLFSPLLKPKYIKLYPWLGDIFTNDLLDT